MSRLELEEHVVHFNRNIDNCKDTTHLESDKARFIFIPIENLFLILITSKQSNIIEDTEILKLIYRLVKDICGTISDAQILSNCFELIMGIDDIVCLGYRNSVSLAQVKQFMQMESQEEKEFKKKLEERENEAKRQMIEKMKEIEKLKKQNKYVDDSISSDKFENPIKLGDKFEITPIEKVQVKEIDSEGTKVIITSTSSQVKEGKKAPSKGMKLSKKKKDEDNEEA